MPAPEPSRAVLFALTLIPLVAACREGQSNQSSFNPLMAPGFSNQGCNGTGVTPAAPTAIFTDGALIGPGSHIVAAPTMGDDQLWLTGADGSIHRLDVPSVGAPMDTVVLAAGEIESQYLVPNGIAQPASLSGLTLLDPANLLVVEETSNSILLVGLVAPVSVSNFAGLPDTVGGFADNPPGLVRFSFNGPTQILATPLGEVFVADPGNHAVRMLQAGTVIATMTVAGTGSPFFRDGSLGSVGFDTPTGLAVSCGGELVVTELGVSAIAGHRVRSLGIGDLNFFGSFTGTATTLAGDGTPATTEGVDDGASTDAPMSPVTTGSEILWMDSATGILRRHDLATGTNDCPLFSDCDAAVMAGGSFTPGAVFSLAIGSSGTLYVLDGTAGTISTVSL